ncbi:MAG TPA: PBP1A family penicillin-binding protein [Fibrobacteria bacterium]|nr:PBP1A family penicillin-binding protein [Fibrobacteria bacterium]
MFNKLIRGIGSLFSDWFRHVRRDLAKKAYRRSVLRWLVILGLLPALGAVSLAALVLVKLRSLPSLETLERIEPNLITKVYDKDTALIHEFYTQRRIWTPAARIPKAQKLAVFAIEDQKFYRHWGVDLAAYPSALLPVLVGKRARGASTLTQQLAKNLFLTPERSVMRKLMEVLVAVQIERTYTKDEILEFYFNQVYLGSGAYGFAAAAQRYFSKPLDSLAINQYALLAGLLQRPESYRPDVYPEAARDRRNTVLGAMRSMGYISRAQLKETLKSGLDVKMWQPPTGFAGYFVETVRQFMEKKWNEDLVYNQGVTVYTTLDSSLQDFAESTLVANLHKTRVRLRYRTARAFNMAGLMKQPMDSIVRHWDETYPRFDSLFLHENDTSVAYQKRFPDSMRYVHAQSALLILDNETGAVRAMVGGENFEKSKYNRALQAVRSPGSSFKPFVYATAVDNGASPGDILNDQPITIPDPIDSTKFWRPHNYDPGFDGKISMRRALYKSKNLPAIEVGMKYGLKTVVSYARKFGLTHSVLPVPSLGIGSCEATLMEMTSAYTAFPDGGVRPTPYLIEKIEDKNGQVIHQNVPQTHEVLRKEAAWIMCTMLRDVNIHGTAAAIWASGFNHPSGGKTGTTNDYNDAWYIGFTKRLTMGIWVGADDHASMGPGHTGADDAVPTWITVMTKAEKGKKPLAFPRPDGVVEATVCQTSGLLAQKFCGLTTTDYYIAGHEPTEPCTQDMHNRTNSGEDIFTANQHKDRRSVAVTTAAGKTADGKDKDKEKEKKPPDHRVRKTF